MEVVIRVFVMMWRLDSGRWQDLFARLMVWMLWREGVGFVGCLIAIAAFLFLYREGGR